MDVVLQLLAELSAPAIAATLISALIGARRRRQDAADRRRAVVIQVIDSLEATVRRHASIKRWLLPAAEIEWALIYPRLLLQLHHRDHAVAGWMWRQVQLMLLEPSSKEQVVVASRIGGQVLGGSRAPSLSRGSRTSFEPIRFDNRSQCRSRYGCDAPYVPSATVSSAADCSWLAAKREGC